MKLSAALSPLIPIREGIRCAFLPFLTDVWKHSIDRSQSQSARLTSLVELRRLFFTHLWATFGGGSDEGSRNMKEELMADVHGVVLDLGAGFGHTARYLPRNQVSSYLAVEPNGLMHFGLRDAAHKAGYLESDGSFFLLPCGAEDTQTIIRTTHSSGGSVDCIVCILTLCSIPDAEKILMRLVRDVLRPGGTLFIFEHVRNRREDVAWWQWLWSPIWSVFFDGCRLDRATDKWVERMEDIDSSGGMMAMWKSVIMKYSTENDLEDNIMPHVLGTFIKHD